MSKPAASPRGSKDGQDVHNAVTHRLIVQDDLEPVEKGRLSFLAYTIFYRLWRVLYFITRVATAYFAILMSVLLTIAILNGVVGFIFNTFLPRALGLSSQFLVGTLCFLSVLAFVTPLAGLVWIAFAMIPEAWSAEECPRTRLMLAYIFGSMADATKHTFSPKFSVAVQFLKLLTFIIVLIVSLVLGDGGTYSVIETLVLSGCIIGLVMYSMWLPLVVVCAVVKFFRKDLLFPDLSVYRSFSQSSEVSAANRLKAHSGGRAGILLVGCGMTLHGVLSAMLVAIALQEIGTDLASLSFSVAALLVAVFITYWTLFSADYLDPDTIPSPNEEPDVVIRVEKNMKLLRVQPVPPRRLGLSLLIIVLMIGLSVALLVVSNMFSSSIFSDSCNAESKLGFDLTNFPNGTRTANKYSDDLLSSVCHQRWHSSKLNALDMALLAQAAYEDNANNRSGACANLSAVGWLNKVYRFSRVNGQSGADWEVRSVYIQRLVARYFELYSPSRGVTVFVVRGDRSDHTGDILETFDMYAPAGIFQFASTFLPLSLSLPASKVSNLLYYVSFTDRLFARPLPTYYQVVAEGVRAAFRRLPGHKWYIQDKGSVFVTGHALGGAVAKVAGSSSGVNIVSISFNGPGLLYSARSFGINAANVERNVNNIVTTNDRFSLLLDELGGSTFRIDCLTQNLSECHQMRAIICKLLSLCGFPDYNFMC